MNTSSLPRAWLLGIAFLQGLCLLVLYRSVESGFWPSESPVWAFPLWTLAVAVPLLLLLSITRENGAAVAKYVAGFAVVLVVLAAYTGWQARPFGEFPVGSLAGIFTITIGLACFKALMYLQQRASAVPLTYQVLFTYSWRNFLVGVLAALFTGIFWLILLLWGRLFRVIGIEFFWELFTEDWFAIPVLAVAFGLGISLFRDLTRVIDNITSLLHWLIKLLLPLVLFVAVVFLGALPFTGLELLWGTGSGTALLLWLLALVLFFTNAVYQDGREADPYPRWLHRAIYVGIAVMPVVAALAFYGLLLRVQQYGWTIERCWAFVVWAVLTLFAIGYVVGIVRRRDGWTGDLARVNTAMGLVVLAILLAANSPLLDFRKISLASQLERVESGEIELAEFDFWYAKQHLARPGYLAMEEMKEEIGESDPELVAMIEEPVHRNAARGLDSEAFWENVRYRPEPFEVPVGLKPLIEGAVPPAPEQVPVVIRADLDGDGSNEYVLLLVGEQRPMFAQLFYRAGSDEGGGPWRRGHMSFSVDAEEGFDREGVLEGDVSLTAPRYRNLRIGGVELQAVR
jgi:hypothetical protein